MSEAHENAFLPSNVATPGIHKPPPQARPMPLDRALKIATHILNELAPLCIKIEIAGSIRRRRPVCGDVDFVCIPKDYETLRERVLKRCTIALKEDGKTPIGDGEEMLVVNMEDGTQLDIWFAKLAHRDLLRRFPSNWGSRMLARTGSKAHNVYIAQLALQQGYRWELKVGLTQAGNWVAGETEEEIFRALQLPYIEPEKRER